MSGRRKRGCKIKRRVRKEEKRGCEGRRRKEKKRKKKRKEKKRNQYRRGCLGLQGLSKQCRWRGGRSA